jgi:hypothetical protein
MKSWHLLIFVLIAYSLGALFPGPFVAVRSQLGV